MKRLNFSHSQFKHVTNHRRIDPRRIEIGFEYLM